MKLTKNTILLILIFLLGSVLRFYALGNIPVGFHRDEAYFGYNAYSVLVTGKDISGNFLPLHIASFLHSPAGYMYFAIPFIAAFGLHEFAVRLPSALLGSLTIPLVYLLVREFFDKYRHKNALGLLASFFLAISPWHINLSRLTTESVLVVFFLTLGVLCYLYWVKTKKAWWLIVSFVCFGGTLLLYQAPRAFLPLFLPLLFLFFHPKPIKKHIVLPVVAFILLIILPILMILSSNDLTQRIRMLSIFHHPQTQLVLDEEIREDGTSGSVAVTRFFHNKAINYSQTFLTNYFKHFSYDFLFTDVGFPDRYRVSNMGLLYIFELPLLLLGMWQLLLAQKRQAGLLLGWVLLAPFGSALTFDDVPNLQRTLIMFPAVSIFIAFGFLQLWQFISNRKFARLYQFACIAIVVYGFFYYLHQYYVHQVLHHPWYRQEGYKELVTKVNELDGKYKQVVISEEESAPSIFFLFYNQYNPNELQQKLAVNKSGDFETAAFPKYKFVKDSCPLDIVPKTDPKSGIIANTITGERNILYVNSIKCKLEDDRIVTHAKVHRTDGTTVFSVQSLK